MYSSEDFERFYIRYKAEGLPRKLTIREYCMRNKVPWNLFNNCKAIGESLYSQHA